MKKFFFCLIFVILACLSGATDYKDCHGKENHLDLVDAKFGFVKKVNHGIKHNYTNGSDDQNIIILHLEGSAYEQGFAMGELMEKEIKFTIPALYDFGFQYIKKYITFFPEFIKEGIRIFIHVFLRELNNICYYLRFNNIPKYFIEEMKGIAEGAKMDYMEIARFNMIPEMLKAFCTLVSIWRPASENDHVFLLRALDWAAEAPLHIYPVITFYHHNDGKSVPFANIGYSGLIGSLVAMNSKQIGIGEQLWGGQNNSRMSFIGQPWHFVLRDMAQFAKNMDEAKMIMIKAHRTCNIHLMVASGTDNVGLGVYYSSKLLTFYDDKNYTRHGIFPGTISFPYHSNECIANILDEHKDHKVTAKTLYQKVAPLHESGDSIMVVMDLTDQVIYISFANSEKGIKAYDRPRFQLDMKPWWPKTLFIE